MTNANPNDLHCRKGVYACRGESYCACQCDRCKAAWEAAPEYYAALSVVEAFSVLRWRLGFCDHGCPACDSCVAHDTMLHMST